MSERGKYQDSFEILCARWHHLWSKSRRYDSVQAENSACNVAFCGNSEASHTRSATVDVTLTKRNDDPTYFLRNAQVLELLADIWDNLMSRAMLVRTFVLARDWAIKGTWRNPKGPIAIVLLSMREATWTINTDKPFIWTDSPFHQERFSRRWTMTSKQNYGRT